MAYSKVKTKKGVDIPVEENKETVKQELPEFNPDPKAKEEKETGPIKEIHVPSEEPMDHYGLDWDAINEQKRKEELLRKRK